MKQRILWAERVPNAPYPMRVADLANLPDDGWTYEIVEGELLRMPASGSKATRLGIRLAVALSIFATPQNLGDVSGADGEYDLTQPGDSTDTVLVPDVAFVAAGRLPAIDSAAADAIPRLVPDLVAEIASPSQYRPEMKAKAQLYMQRGVRLVWVVWPKQQEVDVWRPSSHDAPSATLGITDDLDGLDVLPGFRCPLRSLFT